MAHLNSYDSFQTKRSKAIKERAKEKALGKKNNDEDDFIIEKSNDFGVVIEVRYNDAYILTNAHVLFAKYDSSHALI
jgi:hypothetical protein